MNVASARARLATLLIVVGLLASSPMAEARRPSGGGGGGGGGCQAIDSQVPLVNCGAIPGATGQRRLRVRPNCRKNLRVEIQGVPGGSYPVLVAGTVRGTIVVGALGQGQIEFDTSPGAGQLLLNFDPTGEVDVNTSGGRLVLSQSADLACVSPPPPPPPTCGVSESLVSLVNCGALPAATGTRRLRTRDDCGQNLEIEIQNATAGRSYAVWVGTALRGSITADAFGHGQIEFDTTPMAGQVLLNFDPTGEVDIFDGAVNVFSLTADASCAPSSPTPPPPATCTFSETFVSLVNCGAIPGATGTRRLRTRDDCGKNLEIDIQGVPAGSYTVSVGGAVRGTITADALGNGEIDFDTTPQAGQLLLDFDPTGEIDIVQGSSGARVLSLTADATCPGTTPPPSSTCTVVDNEVSLVNCGAIPAATGKRRVRVQSDCRKDLRIEIQNVAPGSSYDVAVANVSRGTMTADAIGQGQIEYDTQPAPGELLLDFDPFGEIDLFQKATHALVLSLTADTACTGTP